jgi:dihydrofolate reductase
MEIIVACTDNFVIGAEGEMPWHLPADLAHFKRITSGNTIVMGRRTWESIGGALPNRKNIVLTRQIDYKVEGATVIHSIAELQTIETIGTLFIIGGGDLYNNTIGISDVLHVTRIHTTLKGDTFFPKIDDSIWTCEERVEFQKDDNNSFNLTFERWTRG